MPKLGRAFNHLEDLTFFHGSEGVREALVHIQEITTFDGARSLRMKWDGMPVYWGRETSFGPLILSNHNAWERGIKTFCADDIYDFITNQSGTLSKNRIEFATQFSRLYDIFDNATPRGFVGFVYADLLFLEKPTTDANGIYHFKCNPKSETTYCVSHTSYLGQRVAKSKVMAVGHASFESFGSHDDTQIPLDNFDIFNHTDDLIVEDPIYNTGYIHVPLVQIKEIESFLSEHSEDIDDFLSLRSGLSDLKNIIYSYVSQTSKVNELNDMSCEHFKTWLSNSKVSSNKQSRILDLDNQISNALPSIFHLVKHIMFLKDSIIDQLEKNYRGEIRIVNGEGYVRYATPTKKFGNIKLVPRKRWIPK